MQNHKQAAEGKLWAYYKLKCGEGVGSLVYLLINNSNIVWQFGAYYHAIYSWSHKTHIPPGI